MDEVLIHVAPVLIGDSIRLFSQKGMEPVRLEKAEISEVGQKATLNVRTGPYDHEHGALRAQGA